MKSSEVQVENPNEQPELPKGWVRIRLGEVSSVVTKGSTPTSYGFAYVSQGIKFVKVENIADGRIDGRSITEFITPDTHRFLKRSQLSENDVLFSIAGTIGRVAIVHSEDLPANTNQAVAIIRCPWQFISPRYLEAVLESPLTRISIEKRPRGIGMNNVSLEDVKNITWPLPPLAEQQRIVAKIEELFTELDAGVEALRKVKAQLKRYRQAVLKHAFEGKLTGAWREAHKGELEPASILLERIREERSKNLNVGATCRSSRARAPRPYTVDASSLPKLAEGWVWTTVEEITEMMQYGTSEKAGNDSSGIPVIRMGNIQEGKLVLEDLKFFPKGWMQLEDFVLRDGDLLFNRTNSAELVGKTAVYKESHPESVFASYLIRVRVNRSAYNPYMLSYFINSSYGRAYIASVVSQQVGQANVNSRKLSLMPIPLPPLAEQHKIVEEIERRFSIADEVEKVVEQSLQQAERLRQSILKSAFEGKLVPQDPNDEPADKLLERIKQTRIQNVGAHGRAPKRSVYHGK
jgi:type I restriction enzyme S subunit